jgi:hypothetical protein
MWVYRQGGWTSRKTVNDFAAFTVAVFRAASRRPNDPCSPTVPPPASHRQTKQHAEAQQPDVIELTRAKARRAPPVGEQSRVV